MAEPSAPPVCYRHPGVPTRILCQRCNRPIGPECMNDSAVGFQCPECVSQGVRETRQAELPYGGTRSQDPRRTTFALIGINVAVWVAVLLTGGAFGKVFNLLAITPAGYCGPTADNRIMLINEAQCATTGLPWVDGVASGAWWQVLTSAFTHAEVLHIAFNMFALWILGPQLERLLGRARFLALYLVSALAASAFVMLFSAPYVSTMGASGAIFGMLGAFLLVARKHGGNVRQILILLGANIAITVVGSGYISWQGHFGGLIGGLAVTAALIHLPKERRKQWQWPLVGVIAVASLAAVAVKVFQLA
ncbi:MAG: rhomboid family intramembrane serine protease [Arachnia sp.]